MNKNKLDIFITTLLFLLFFGIMKPILLNQQTTIPIWQQSLFFFHNIWDVESFNKQ